MKKYILLIFVGLVFSCAKKEKPFNNELTLSLGSCNNQNIKNMLFKEILKNKPNTFIWLGDIIYSDTDNPKILEDNFIKFKQDSTYTNFRNNVKILGVWDDHDYGVNDGGLENNIKKEAQQYLLDFFDVAKNDLRRKQEGTYFSKTIKKDTNSVKIIGLDTRYFRTSLTKDTTGKKRYIPNNYGEGTLLGTKQWQWLKDQLTNNNSDFTLILSSIQFLSNQHGFESWATMPHETDKLKQLIIATNSKNVIILSGDRHISEIAKTNLGIKKNQLIDFTSSGLTHAYNSFKGENNPFRISNVITENNFGLLKFDFKKNQVLFEIRGNENVLLEQHLEKY